MCIQMQTVPHSWSSLYTTKKNKKGCSRGTPPQGAKNNTTGSRSAACFFVQKIVWQKSRAYTVKKLGVDRKGREVNYPPLMCGVPHLEVGELQLRGASLFLPTRSQVYRMAATIQTLNSLWICPQPILIEIAVPYQASVSGYSKSNI